MTLISATSHYIKTLSTTVNFTGLYRVFPEEGEMSQQRFGSTIRTIPTFEGGVIKPGRTIRFDQGTDITDQEVAVTVGLVDIAMRKAINDIFSASVGTTFKWSPNDGQEEYVVSWVPGFKIVWQPIPFYPGYWSVQLRFGVLQKSIIGVQGDSPSCQS